MGREVRKVPNDWVHPRGNDGCHKPLHCVTDFHAVAREWIASMLKWEAGENADRGKFGCVYYWDYAGNPPHDEDYMLVDVPAERRTHFMLYETTTEGTPHKDSPVFETIEALCEWAETHATTFASYTATKDEWRKMLDDNFVHHEEPGDPATGRPTMVFL